MTRIVRGFLWLLMLGLFSGWAVWAAPAAPPFGVYAGAMYSPTITVLESDSVIRLELTMEHLHPTGTINLNNKLPGTWGEMNPTGARIPRFSIYLALPGSGNPQLTEELWEDSSFAALPVTLAGNTDHTHTTVGAVGILGGVRVVPITFRPVNYVNLNDTCDVMTHAIIAVRMDNTAGTNPVATPRLNFSRPWQRLFQTIVTNWQYIPNINVGANSHILMFVPDGTGGNDFIPSVQDFVRWKEQRGIKVTVVPTSSLGGNVTAQIIKTRILTELQTSDPTIDYVILVGDETKLPVSMLNTPDPVTMFSTASDPGNYTNELFYSAVVGTDVFPDVFVGRWVANTQQDVMKIAGRSIQHERDTFLADSLRFSKGVVSADDQANSQWFAVRRTKDMMLGHGFTVVDTIVGHGNSAIMANRINQGRAFINYRGEGWDFGWYGIDFYVGDIASLTNRNKLPIVTGIGCGVGIFNSAQDNSGFGEAFMLAGTLTQPAGAAGFIGPCWNTHTVFNDCLDSSLYRGWFDYGNLNLSPGLAAGKMMSWAIFSAFLYDADVQEVTETLMRQYHVESDPSLQVFTQTPVRLQVTMPDTAYYGVATTLPISITGVDSIPAESLNVTVWQNDSTFHAFWMPSTQTSITVPVTADSTDTLTVTITGDNVLAYRKVLRLVASPDVAANPHVFKPNVLGLAQNFPNPFNPETTIEFNLPSQDWIRLEVYNILGRRVATLAQGDLGAGYHRVVWKGTNDDGTGATSGLYYYRLTTAHGTLARKMLLMK